MAMRSMGKNVTLAAISLVFLWAGTAQATNVIIMIGDGMGPDQVEAGRLLDADGVLVVDEVDSDPGSVNTLNYFGGITDSAASATAYATAQKTANGNVSFLFDDSGPIYPTNMEVAVQQGMGTGILSDVYLCDATPGVWLAHAYRRSCSLIIPQQIGACPDVFLGPGEKVAYARQQSPDYIKMLVDNCGYARVKKPKDLAQAQPSDPSNEGRLLGIWGGYTLMYDIDRQNDPGNTHPTLAEMTAKAIDVLSNEDEYPDGFFLVVEGGGIDWMAHNKDIAGTARGVLAFNEAVAVAYDFAQADGDTLLVVTADHETGGLDLGDSPNVAFIEGITASTDFMYGLVLRGEMSAEDALETYAGVTDLTQAEKDAIAAYGEVAMSDALSARANVVWWLPEGVPAVAPDEGNHTATEVEVYAYGPGSDALEGAIDNTDIGQALYDAVNGP
jgi:alkaline phosphatase